MFCLTCDVTVNYIMEFPSLCLDFIVSSNGSGSEDKNDVNKDIDDCSNLTTTIVYVV